MCPKSAAAARTAGRGSQGPGDPCVEPPEVPRPGSEQPHDGLTNLATCMNDVNTALPTDRLFAVDGEADPYFDGNAETIRKQLEAVTGVSCGVGALSCNLPNGAGWYIVSNAEVVDGTADDCYQRGNLNCADTLRTG